MSDNARGSGTDRTTDRTELRGDGADRAALRADCANCFGLCCVALTLTRSADFAVNKDAGQPCHNLQDDFRCGIHTELRTQGFPGCTVYDCFGAGQKVSQETFDGQDWRRAPQTAQQMFQVFPVMRQLHELLWYLTEALTLHAARPLHGEIRRALDTTERLTHVAPDAFADLDVAGHRDDVAALLLRTSELVRAGAPARRSGTTAAPTSWAPGSRAPTCRGPTCAAPISSPPTSPAPTCVWPTSSARISGMPNCREPT